MSEIIVNKVTFGDDSFQQTAADRSFRNKIINGDFSVDQEFAGSATTPSVPGANYVCDQFGAYITQASKLTFQRVVDAPPGFKYSQKITVASQYSPGASDAFYYYQKIEGLNIIDLNLGTALPEKITISLRVKGSVPGVYNCALAGATNRYYVGKINVTTTWSTQILVLTADGISQTWATDNTAGLTLIIDLGSGSNYYASADTWGTGSFLRTSDSVTFVNQPVGSTLNITGVQLEKAGAPSEFEHVPYDEQLRRCQRYWEKIYIQIIGSGSVGGNFIGGVISFIEKRVPPSTSVISVDENSNFGAIQIAVNSLKALRCFSTTTNPGNAYYSALHIVNARM